MGEVERGKRGENGGERRRCKKEKESYDVLLTLHGLETRETRNIDIFGSSHNVGYLISEREARKRGRMEEEGPSWCEI